MPELPDINLYIEKLEQRIDGSTLEDIRIQKPFLLRSVDPPLGNAIGRNVTGLKRIGKRIAIGLEGEIWLILHLMVAGRLRWLEDKATIHGRNQLAAFDSSTGSLLLTEAGTKKRASLYLVKGLEQLKQHDPGGIEPLKSGFEEFRQALLSENRTLKRALTDPRKFSGIGNAYSDEILHAARLSPIAHSHRLHAAEQRRLFDATRSTLQMWCERLRAESGHEFPQKVTAFREGMAVHGRFGKPCPACGAPVQRIRYKSNETNYCPECQTGGRILADRSLSRLLKADWPAFFDE